MELLVIRHGQSEADFPLTELEDGQARKMAATVAIEFSREFNNGVLRIVRRRIR